MGYYYFQNEPTMIEHVVAIRQILINQLEKNFIKIPQ